MLAELLSVHGVRHERGSLMCRLSLLCRRVVGDSATTGTLTYPSGVGTASVALSQVGSYPIFEAEVSYASLGGTGAPRVVSVTIDATTTASPPELRWSLVTRR